MNIRRFAASAVLVVASFTTAFTAGTVAASAGTVTSSPDAAACSAVYHFHHVNTVPSLYADEALWQSAYRAAMDAALKASPDVSGVIVHYLREGDQWSWVRAACASRVVRRG